MNAPNRRTLLTAAAAAPVAFSWSADAATPHPDAALLALWEDYGAAAREAEAIGLPDDCNLDDEAPVWKRVDALRDRIERTPAKTLDGVAVKIRHLLAVNFAPGDTFGVLVLGRAAPPGWAEKLADDTLLAMLWEMANAPSDGVSQGAA